MAPSDRESIPEESGIGHGVLCTGACRGYRKRRHPCGDETLRILTLCLALPLVLAPLAAPAMAEPASTAFGAVDGPAPGKPQVFGSYAKGCHAGAVRIAADGPTWAAMRLSRDRRWAQPELADFVVRLSNRARRAGLGGLLIGDTGQARGGPMKSGHRSHQTGLDVDIWLRPLTTRPDAAARENLSSYDVVKGRRTLDEALWRKSAARAIPLAAADPAVARIFVHPVIKRALCEATEPGARPWMNKIRPWWGHDAHFHVRLACPAGSPACENQKPPPPGDGCGTELDWWFTDEPYETKGAIKPRKELTMDDLPPACRAVVAAD